MKIFETFLFNDIHDIMDLNGMPETWRQEIVVPLLNRHRKTRSYLKLIIPSVMIVIILTEKKIFFKMVAHKPDTPKIRDSS